MIEKFTDRVNARDMTHVVLMDVGRRAGVLIANQGIIMSQIRYELPKKARMHVNKMNMLEIGANQPEFIEM